MQALGARVVGELRACGFAADPHGATAAQPLFDRSFTAWRGLIRSVVEDPDHDKALVFLSLLFDGPLRPCDRDARDPLEELRQVWHRPACFASCCGLALGAPAPDGIPAVSDLARDFVVEHSGEHRGRLDIKGGGLLPVVGIARYASLAAGVRTTSTRERLSSPPPRARSTDAMPGTLDEAHDLFWRLRLDHQVEQLRQGEEPDDYIDIGKLNPSTRRDAARGVSRRQRGAALPQGQSSRLPP